MPIWARPEKNSDLIFLKPVVSFLETSPGTSGATTMETSSWGSWDFKMWPTRKPGLVLLKNAGWRGGDCWRTVLFKAYTLEAEKFFSGKIMILFREHNEMPWVQAKTQNFVKLWKEENFPKTENLENHSSEHSYFLGFWWSQGKVDQRWR